MSFSSDREYTRFLVTLNQSYYTMSFDLSITMRFGVEVQMADRKTMGNPAINCYQDRDGRWFWIVGLEGERHWPPLCRSVGHPEWIDDARFAIDPVTGVITLAMADMLDFETEPTVDLTVTATSSDFSTATQRTMPIKR